MSFKTLLEPVTENGIKNTHYFEGRLLSGKDLTEQEAANKRHRQQLGKILDHGVVDGLEVSVENIGAGAADPLVRIKKGMAVTLDGVVVELPVEYIDIQLSRTLESVDPSLTGFKNCTDLPSETLVPSGAGLYILIMSPASAYREYAPKSGLQKQGIAQNCGRAYLVEGVQFRLVKFDPTLMPDISESVRDKLKDDLLSDSTPVNASDLEDLSLMRNLVANVCLGTGSTFSFATEPNFIFKPTASIGLDALLGLDEGLASCDTPLALIYWNLDGIVFVDNWAVRRMVHQSTPGVLRINQFAYQLDWLFDELGSSAVQAIDNYFRFIPPAAYIPYRVTNALEGFRAEEFFADLYRGISDKSRIGQMNRILRDSLDYPSLDLTHENFLQLFTSMKLDDLPNEFSTQPYFLYLSRNLFHISVNDDIAKVVADTWDVYHGLIKRQVFLPPASDSEKITARLTIDNALRDVLAMANRYSAIAGNDGLDERGVMHVFADLFRVQMEMVEVFAGDIPGIDDTQERELFADAIDHILTVVTPPDAGPSYQVAVQNAEINVALNSQIEINRFVGQWSGEGVAVGPFGFTYEGSPQGANLVPGAGATPHLFTLVNGTNKSLQFGLSSNVFANSGDWSDSSTILRALNGGQINTLNLNSGASATIVVMIAAPLDAIEGESATIQLTAEVGPPTSRSNIYESSELFLVDVNPGDPVTGIVTIDSYSFAGLTGGPVDITDLNPGEILTLSAFIFYEVAGTNVADFALDIVIETSPHDEWQFFRNDTPDPLPEDPAGTYTLNLEDLTGSNTQNTARLRIVTPDTRDAASDKSISFRLHVRSTSLADEISTTHEDLITLTVQAGS